MKKLALILLLLSSTAYAADLPAAKAQATAAPYSCVPAACNGWYVGGVVEGAGPLATGQADLTNGAGIGAVAGYQFWQGQWYFAGEVGLTGYFGQSTFVPVAGGPSVEPGKWSATYLAKAGYGLQGFLSTGNTTAPSQGIFGNLVNMSTPYALVGGRTRQFGTGFTSGAGIDFVVGNRWNIAVEYLHTSYNTTVGNVPVGTEQDARLVFKYMF